MLRLQYCSDISKGGDPGNGWLMLVVNMDLHVSDYCGWSTALQAPVVFDMPGIREFLRFRGVKFNGGIAQSSKLWWICWIRIRHRFHMTNWEQDTWSHEHSRVGSQHGHMEQKTWMCTVRSRENPCCFLRYRFRLSAENDVETPHEKKCFQVGLVIVVSFVYTYCCPKSPLHSGC